MSIQSRYNKTVAITVAAKLVDDGYGGVKAPDSPAVAVAAYKCMVWAPTLFRQQMTIQQHGLKDDAEIMNVTGDYDSAIEAGQTLTVDSEDWLLLSAREVRGAGITPIRLSIVLVKQGKNT